MILRCKKLICKKNYGKYHKQIFSVAFSSEEQYDAYHYHSYYKP